MNPMEELLNRRWILKSQDVELYYRVKDSLKEIRKIVQEKFGYIIVVNPYLIKLEKIPGKAEPWMGIQEFQSVLEYQMFCYLLMFLEDKEREQQFVLSNLTEYMQMQFPEGMIDWKSLINRRQLIRVLRYSLNVGLMKLNDGDSDRFALHQDTEVLYENTGTSRYFLRNFMREIMEYKTPQEFEQSEWVSMDEDRGIVRRQRVYRRLLLSPGVYRKDANDDDFLYIRNYRNQIQSDFQSFFPCDLHIHRSSAYLNLAEECPMGLVFPFHHTLSDLVLLMNQELVEQIKNKRIYPVNQEQIILTRIEFMEICEKVIGKHLRYLPKKYQESGSENVVAAVLETMMKYGFMEAMGMDELLIYPIVGKVTGGYCVNGEGESC